MEDGMGAALRRTDRGIRSVTDRWAESSSPCGWSSPMPHARFWHKGARDYDPAVGRWTSKDPIRFAGGTNLYVYCEGDPVNCIDTNGHWAQILVGAVVGAAASIAVQAFLNGPNNIDWRSVGGAAVAGALFTVIGPWAGGAGAALRVTGGEALGWAGAGALSNVAGLEAASRLPGGTRPTAGDYVGAAVCGAIAGPIAGRATPRTPGLPFMLHPSGNLTVVDVLLNNLARSMHTVTFVATREGVSAAISNLPVGAPAQEPGELW